MKAMKSFEQNRPCIKRQLQPLYSHEIADKTKSREPVNSQALTQNKIEEQGFKML